MRRWQEIRIKRHLQKRIKVGDRNEKLTKINEGEFDFNKIGFRLSKSSRDAVD